MLPLREAALTAVENIEDAVDIEESRDFQIISEENEDGQLLLSIRRIEYKLAWEKVVAVSRVPGIDRIDSGCPWR